MAGSVGDLSNLMGDFEDDFKDIGGPLSKPGRCAIDGYTFSPDAILALLSMLPVMNHASL